MPIMSDKWIREKAEKDGMISPFIQSQIREIGAKKIISYGVSSYGYDARVSNEFKIFTNIIHLTLTNLRNILTLKII